MKNINNDFSYLGREYEFSLIYQLLVDKSFSRSIMDDLKVSYFDYSNCKLIFNRIKNFYIDYAYTPDKEMLINEIKDNERNESRLKILEDTVELIINRNTDKTDVAQKQTQDLAFKFVKQQEAKKLWFRTKELLEKGDNLDVLESEWKKVFDIGMKNEGGLSVFDDIDVVFSENIRKTTSTGISGLDNIMKGGLGSGELALVIAPSGTGKTTLATYLANKGFMDGKNVLQVFFEDSSEQIQAKHATCFTGVPLDELYLISDEDRKKIKKIKEEKSNHLQLKKFVNGITTVNNIKNYVNKLKLDGIKIDMLLVDYVDCLVSSHRSNDPLESETLVMRELEALCEELDIAIWAFTQTNRSGLNKDMVGGEMMQGSFKKYQIAHFNMSIAKTDDQKVDGLASISVLKSRIGDDGIYIQDIIFKNKDMVIEFDEFDTSLSFMEAKKNKQEEKTNNALSKIAKMQNIKASK